MKYVPKEIHTEVNVTSIHPLKYLAKVALILIFWAIVIYIASGIIADQIAKVVSPEIEASIGKSLVAPVAISKEHPETESQLQQLLDQLQTQQQTRLPRAEMHIIESEVVNAGVFPGGQMIITSAMLDQLESENELAFILAHELGHHQYRHPIRRLGRSLLWLFILSILGIGQQTQTVPTPSAPLTVADLQFSRTQEQVSDQFALAIIEARYGHIDHALDFFQRLQDLKGNKNLQLEWLSTHPVPNTRLRDLRTYARHQNWSLTGPVVPITLR